MFDNKSLLKCISFLCLLTFFNVSSASWAEKRELAKAQKNEKNELERQQNEELNLFKKQQEEKSKKQKLKHLTEKEKLKLGLENEKNVPTSVIAFGGVMAGIKNHDGSERVKQDVNLHLPKPIPLSFPAERPSHQAALGAPVNSYPPYAPNQYQHIAPYYSTDADHEVFPSAPPMTLYDDRINYPAVPALYEHKYGNDFIDVDAYVFKVSKIAFADGKYFSGYCADNGLVLHVIMGKKKVSSEELSDPTAVRTTIKLSKEAKEKKQSFYDYILVKNKEELAKDFCGSDNNVTKIRIFLRKKSGFEIKDLNDDDKVKIDSEFFESHSD